MATAIAAVQIAGCRFTWPSPWALLGTLDGGENDSLQDGTTKTRIPLCAAHPAASCSDAITVGLEPSCTMPSSVVGDVTEMKGFDDDDVPNEIVAQVHSSTFRPRAALNKIAQPSKAELVGSCPTLPSRDGEAQTEPLEISLLPSYKTDRTDIVEHLDLDLQKAVKSYLAAEELAWEIEEMSRQRCTEGVAHCSFEASARISHENGRSQADCSCLAGPVSLVFGGRAHSSGPEAIEDRHAPHSSTPTLPTSTAAEPKLAKTSQLAVRSNSRPTKLAIRTNSRPHRRAAPPFMEAAGTQSTSYVPAEIAEEILNSKQTIATHEALPECLPCSPSNEIVTELTDDGLATADNPDVPGTVVHSPA